MTEPVLDHELVAELAEIMGADFDGLVEAFERDGRQRLARLRELNGVAPEQLREMAHSFKGSSSNLGAVRMAELCRGLEENSADRQRADELIGQLAEAFEQALQALMEYRSA